MAGYKFKYQQQLDNTLNSILNREKFSYNMNADAMYNLYKDQYMNQGNRDMRDTMGNLAGNTGGYVSSAAVNAGNNAYQQQMTALNNRIPELYQTSLNRYNTETNNLYSMFNVLSQMDQSAYTKYRGKVADDQADRQDKLNRERYLT